MQAIHEAIRTAGALIVNPGAWTHYSYAIRDALAMLSTPIVEVHMSDVEQPRAVASRLGDRGRRRKAHRGAGRRRLPAGARVARRMVARGGAACANGSALSFPGEYDPSDATASAVCVRASNRTTSRRSSITGPGSVRWLTGYGGSNGLCIVTPTEQRFLTDFRYGSGVAYLRDSWDVQVVDQNLIGVLATEMPSLVGGARRVGFEASRLTYAHWATLEAAAHDDSISLVPTTNLVEDVRARKSPDEIELIRAGAEINDRVYEWLASEGLDGRSERDWVFAIAERMRELGADGPAFDSIVAAGANGASPHAVPGPTVIERGTLVVLDIGALVSGYCSDCTRTFATGHTDDAKREVYEVVLRAQEAALELVRPGTPCIEVHETARRVIDEAGYGEFFNHGTGHGVGVEMHEEPRFRTGFGRRPRAR